MRFAHLIPLLLLACGSTPPKTSVTATTTTGQGHTILVDASSCWLGGLWADALGEKGDARLAGIEKRCVAVLGEMGATTEQSYYPLRALDSKVVDQLVRTVERTAEHDPSDAPRAQALVKLLRAFADAARETTHARHAADAVKEAIGVQKPDDVRATKVAAAPELKQLQALHALFVLTDGPFAADARALALLEALDRMEIARGLPKHLKVYAVGGAYKEVFGVEMPPVPDDAPAPIKATIWLDVLVKTAEAAGHPVPAEAHEFYDREPLAWTGVLEGFADNLRKVAPTLPASPLRDVVSAVAARLDQEFQNQQAVFASHKTQPL